MGSKAALKSIASQAPFGFAVVVLWFAFFILGAVTGYVLIRLRSPHVRPWELRSVKNLAWLLMVLWLGLAALLLLVAFWIVFSRT